MRNFLSMALTRLFNVLNALHRDIKLYRPIVTPVTPEGEEENK
jgi:hypothetical protein